MRWLLALALVGGLVATGATMALDQQQEDVLTTIDTVPSKTLYESLPQMPLDQTDLETIAADGSASPAFRLRAIYALSTYCAAPCSSTDPAHVTLANLITAYGAAQSGSDLLILRGAAEAIGPMQVPGDLDALTALLNHPSRDIRATAALALGALCNGSATSALHQRLQNESTDQVKLAISAALQVLPCP
jgi:hypothetical protein